MHMTPSPQKEMALHITMKPTYLKQVLTLPRRDNNSSSSSSNLEGDVDVVEPVWLT
jgi:hypothetical protein